MPRLPPRSVSDADEADEKREEAERITRDEMMRRFASQGAVHQNLRRFRLREGYKKQELARLMEVTPRTYYSYEQGVRPIPSSALAKLAILTGGDLNEIVLGRPARNERKVIEEALEGMKMVSEFLAAEYPAMDNHTIFKIAYFHAIKDWDDLPKFDPEIIREAVKMVTGFRHHPEEIPPPPFSDEYEDADDWERDFEFWQRMVEEELGPRGE